MKKKRRKSPVTAVRRLLKAGEESRLTAAEEFLLTLCDDNWEAYRALTHLQLESVLSNFRDIARKKRLHDIERSADTILKFMANHPDSSSKAMLAVGRDPEAIERDAWSYMRDLADRNFAAMCAVATVAIHLFISGATERGFTKVAELFQQLEKPEMWESSRPPAQKWVQ